MDNNTYLTQQDISGKANTADLATVAFSGSYNDLANKPTIPAAQVNSDWNATSGVAKILNKPALAAVATSGSYNDLTNKPTIPADNGLVHIAGDETITGSKKVTSDFTVKSTTASGVTPFLTFQRGTATDSYVDWKINSEGGKLQFFYSTSGTDTKKFDINNTRALFANNVEAAKFVKTGGTSSQFLKADGSVDNNTYANMSDLATVATSGNYNDLTNKPTIPTVNDATLTIKQNGTSLGTFTANQSTNKTISITTLTADEVQTMINNALSEMQQQVDSLKDELSSVQDVLSVMPQPSYYRVPSSGTKSITLDNSVTHVEVCDWGGPNGNYDNSWDGSLTLVTRDDNKVFKITGAYYHTENNYDYLYIYNGSGNVNANTIVKLSGEFVSSEPIYSTGDTITIRFSSDYSNHDYNGFYLYVDIVSKPLCTEAKAVDVKGNYYSTVQIGNQCWMKENLRTQYYADGTQIPLGSSSSTTNGYRYDYSTSSLTLEQRGYLYDWAAVMHGESSSNANPSGVQGICPSGWHVPSDAEWTQLKNYVGGVSNYQCGGSSTYIAKALASTTGWVNSNPYNYTCAVCNNQTSNNATGFNAYPAGYWNNGFSETGESTYFWSSTVSGSSAKVRVIYNYDTMLFSSTSSSSSGRSVRCVRNE